MTFTAAALPTGVPALAITTPTARIIALCRDAHAAEIAAALDALQLRC